MSTFTAFISRLVTGSTAFNTLNIPTVPVTFQTSPGVPSGNDRGIADLEFRVLSGANVIQTGKTPADGRIQVRVPGGRSTLEILDGATPVATYDVRVHTQALEADSTIEGIQRRLRLLGYQIGRDGAETDGVSPNINKRFDRAILDFQIDQKLNIDGRVDATTTTKINDAVNALP
jgi:hypothetical protein